jgi:hypothetical protein
MFITATENSGSSFYLLFEFVCLTYTVNLNKEFYVCIFLFLVYDSCIDSLIYCTAFLTTRFKFYRTGPLRHLRDRRVLLTLALKIILAGFLIFIFAKINND